MEGHRICWDTASELLGSSLAPGIHLVGGVLHLGPLVDLLRRGVVQGGALAVPSNHSCLTTLPNLKVVQSQAPTWRTRCRWGIIGNGAEVIPLFPTRMGSAGA